MKMPAGKYWIGDLCYVLGDVWGEFCDLIFTPGNEDKILTLKDGRTFWSHSTAWGDGLYQTSSPGVEIGVDSGTIGCVLLENVIESVLRSADPSLSDLGHVVEFTEPFTPSYLDGTFYFGKFLVYTEGLETEDYGDEDDADINDFWEK